MGMRTAVSFALLWCLSASPQKMFGLAETDRKLAIRVEQDRKWDPTRFSVSCEDGYDTPAGLEISFIPDNTPSVVQILAFLDSLSTQRQPELHPDQQGKGFVVSSRSFGSYIGPLKISKSGGTCQDTEGVFRCKAVYQSPDNASFALVFNETRLQPCLPGAVATIEQDKFVCRVDPNLAAELYSLEISYVRVGSNERLVLANINGFLNDAQVRKNWNVKAEGQIFPSQPARSSLNLTSLRTSTIASPLLQKSIYTCKAVYLGLNATAGIIESFTDQKGPFVYF